MGSSNGVTDGAMPRMQDRFAGKPMTYNRRHTALGDLTGLPHRQNCRQQWHKQVDDRLSSSSRCDSSRAREILRALLLAVQ